MVEPLPRARRPAEPSGFRGLTFISLVLAAGAAWVGMVTLFPETFLAGSYIVDEAQSTLVRTLINVLPIWPLLFGIAAVVMATAAIQKRFVAYAHSYAAFVWGTFGSVFVLQSAFYEPPRSVLTGGLALVAAVAHVGMVLAWGDQGVK
jgi:hypothetical protein